MNVMLIYDHFMYYWFVHANIELSLVVGWLDVELLSGLKFLWSVLSKEGVWVVNYRNHMDCEAVCGLMGRFYQVMI